MNVRLALLAALLLGLAVRASAAPAANAQARTALETPRVYDGVPSRPGAPAVYAGDPSNRPARSPEQLADEEQRRAAARAALAVKPIGRPTEVPQPEKKALTAWNPLLNGAKGGLLMAVAGFVLGGPLGMLVGAAVGGFTAWGLTKIDDA